MKCAAFECNNQVQGFQEIPEFKMPKRRDEIVLGEENILNAYDTDVGEEFLNAGPWDLDKYCSEMEVRIVSESNHGFELCFDAVNIDAPFTNAVRRVLISHVPTMAIEKLYLYQNTSLVQDEILAHRLGLIPIKADPRLFKMHKPVEKKKDQAPEEPQNPDPETTIVFELHVKCTKRAGAPASTDPSEIYEHSTVYTRDFKWVPLPGQLERLGAEPRPVHPDIIIAKLRPGQEMELRVHCHKGIGSDHAKFSPVATASYRLLPTIRLKEDPETGAPFQIKGEAARRFQAAFSTGVVAVKEHDGEEVAEIVDARSDMCSRNVFRHPDLASKVLLGRKRRHFIFVVESTEALQSAELVTEACTILQDKCTDLLAQLDAATKEL